MRRHLIVGIACVFVMAMTSGHRLTSAAAPIEPARCGQLLMLKLPDVHVTESVSVPAASTGAVRVPHCRVTGVIGSEIGFRLLLPDQWNQKFLMGGGGGFVGSIANQVERVVNDGYATIGTDTGHQGAGVTDAAALLDRHRSSVRIVEMAMRKTTAAKRDTGLLNILDRMKVGDEYSFAGRLRENSRGQWSLGDLLIILEAPREVLLYSYDKHYRIICDALSRSLHNGYSPYLDTTALDS